MQGAKDPQAILQAVPELINAKVLASVLITINKWVRVQKCVASCKVVEHALLVLLWEQERWSICFHTHASVNPCTQYQLARDPVEVLENDPDIVRRAQVGGFALVYVVSPGFSFV